MSDRRRRVSIRAPGPGFRRATIAIAVAVLLAAVVALSIGLVWRLDVFDPKTTATNGQVLAAAFALIGSLVAASFTFIGVLLKYSIDARTVQQADETEKRLRLETCIRAVELLTEDGKPATQNRQSGALFVLVNLDQLDFAYALLGQMWASGDVSDGAAAWVLNQILLRGGSYLQISAASLLLTNAEKLVEHDDDLQFPDCAYIAWDDELPNNARENLLSALLEAVLSKPFGTWSEGSLFSFIIHLELVRRKDREAYMRNGATLCLAALIDVCKFDEGETILGLDGEIDLDKLRSELADTIASMPPRQLVQAHITLANRLRDWRTTDTAGNTETAEEAATAP